MRVHDVERHLRGVEPEAVFPRHFQHVQMDVRILVAGKSDVADFAGLARFEHGGVRAFLIEDAVRILKAEDLVMLHEIDVVERRRGARLLDLRRCLLFRPPVDLGHDEGLGAVAVTESLAHAEFGESVEVVPRVVEEVDSAIESAADDADGKFLADRGQAEMPAADADGGDFFTSAAELAVCISVA